MLSNLIKYNIYYKYFKKLETNEKGDIKISFKDLLFLPKTQKKINGDYSCTFNKLISLKDSSSRNKWKF